MPKRLSTCILFLLLSTSAAWTDPLAPSGLMCELLAEPATTHITDPSPEFTWIVNSSQPNDIQSAYQILVATTQANLKPGTADMWDSGIIHSRESACVTYDGKKLASNSQYFWKVRTHDKNNKPGPYSEPQRFRTGTLSGTHATAQYPLAKSEIAPQRIIERAPGHYYIDFGKAAFGTVKLTLDSDSDGHEVEVHLGEVPAGADTIDRKPGGSRRYRKMVLPLKRGTHTYTVQITTDARNTRPRAIKMPPETGEVMPFRYCEIINSPSKLDTSLIRQVVVNYPFNDTAAHFDSSSKVLNDVWELCKYSIKATSFCGVYVDGDRERIPYEADAYINQLCHYAVDREFTMARYSHEYLITNATWPTEWILSSVIMAWADYLHTGNTESFDAYYDDLAAKTLAAIAREDGLISAKTGLVTPEILRSIHLDDTLRPVVDWPHGGILGLKEGGFGETDGFVFQPINTVVNAYHYRALVLMARMAEALGKDDDAQQFRKKAALVKATVNTKLFDPKRGVYIDGEGTDHASLHANMFPLAFGLVPQENRATVAEFVKSRGMACSVYGSQHLLDALYEVGEGDYALSLMTSTEERSWAHMIYDVGTTISLEAWDNRFKPNQDWNHAWGAAPANAIPRGLMGIQPLEPAFRKMQIKPQVGDLRKGRLILPTISGPIEVAFEQEPETSFKLEITIPANTTARVCIPAQGAKEATLDIDGTTRTGILEGDFIVIDNIGSGAHTFMR